MHKKESINNSHVHRLKAFLMLLKAYFKCFFLHSLVTNTDSQHWCFFSANFEIFFNKNKDKNGPFIAFKKNDTS